MKTIILLIFALGFSSCASMERSAKVCTYNLLTRWMSSGSPSYVGGDVKKATEVIGKYRMVEGVCHEGPNVPKDL